MAAETEKGGADDVAGDKDERVQITNISKNDSNYTSQYTKGRKFNKRRQDPTSKNVWK